MWRPGSGRRPCSREFTVTFPPVQPEEDAEAAAAEAAAAEAEAAAAQAAALAAQAEALAAEAAEQLLEHVEEQQWEEEGVLAEARQQARLRPADASAGTPGTALLQQDGQPAATADRQQQTSQRGQARTPGTSLFGRYTPMEGVPERLAALAASRGKLLPATVLRSGGPRAAAASTPAGFTPLEGIPERLGALRQLPGGPRLLSLPGATRICSNEAEASVDSPVEGLVQQGTKRSRGSGDAPSPADGEAEFAGFALQPSPQAQQEAQQEEVQHDDYDDDMGGFADDGGYQGGELLHRKWAAQDLRHQVRVCACMPCSCWPAAHMQCAALTVTIPAGQQAFDAHALPLLNLQSLRLAAARLAASPSWPAARRGTWRMPVCRQAPALSLGQRQRRQRQRSHCQMAATTAAMRAALTLAAWTTMSSPMQVCGQQCVVGAGAVGSKCCSLHGC